MAELAPYREGAGTLKFLYARPIPLDLISKVTARLLEQRREAGG